MTDAPVILSLPSGLTATVLPLGATLYQLSLPDANGRPVDLLMALPDPADHARLRSYRGVTIGRYAGRLSGAAIPDPDGTGRLPLSDNDAGLCLHGGAQGFDRRPWQVIAQTPDAVTLRLVSPDGDQGFPGELTVTARYALEAPDRLTITYRATTTRACPVSLTNHAFFNLAGGGPVADHLLTVLADQALPTDSRGLPAGPPQPVAGTSLDFRTPRPLGPAIAEPAFAARGGLDHCFVLGTDPGPLRLAAILTDPASGRQMRLETDHPAMNVYSANTPLGPGFTRHGALCLEPHLWLDAPNRPDFPDAVLRPGAEYRHCTRLTFVQGSP